jgi:hypothetical protein
VARRPWSRSAPLRFAGDASLSPLPPGLISPIGANGLISPALIRTPRLLTQAITLMRDLHCIRAGEAYFPFYQGRPGDSPSPDTPVVRSDKPELRQQLTDPKRRICLGSFFCVAWRARRAAANAASDPQACLRQRPVSTLLSRNWPLRRSPTEPDRPRPCAWPPRPQQQGRPKFQPPERRP